MSIIAPLAPPSVAPALATCDRCPQDGTTRFVLPSGLDLVLCGHHSRDLGVHLVAFGAAAEQVSR